MHAAESPHLALKLPTNKLKLEVTENEECRLQGRWILKRVSQSSCDLSKQAVVGTLYHRSFGPAGFQTKAQWGQQHGQGLAQSQSTTTAIHRALTHVWA